MLNTTDLTPLILFGVRIMITTTFGAYLIFSVIFLQKISLLSKIIETTVSPWVSRSTFVNVIITAVFLLISIII